MIGTCWWQVSRCLKVTQAPSTLTLQLKHLETSESDNLYKALSSRHPRSILPISKSSKDRSAGLGSSHRPAAPPPPSFNPKTSPTSNFQYTGRCSLLSPHNKPLPQNHLSLPSKENHRINPQPAHELQHPIQPPSDPQSVHRNVSPQ